MADYISLSDIRRLRIRVPESARLQALKTTTAPLFERIGVAQQEALTLTALRDTLLPKLMSGQFTVKQAESLAEDVT